MKCKLYLDWRYRILYCLPVVCAMRISSSMQDLGSCCQRQQVISSLIPPSPHHSGNRYGWEVYNTMKSHPPIGQVLKSNMVSPDCRTVLLVNDMQSEYISRNIQLRYIYTGSFFNPSETAMARTPDNFKKLFIRFR